MMKLSNFAGSFCWACLGLVMFLACSAVGKDLKKVHAPSDGYAYRLTLVPPFKALFYIKSNRYPDGPVLLESLEVRRGKAVEVEVWQRIWKGSGKTPGVVRSGWRLVGDPVGRPSVDSSWYGVSFLDLQDVTFTYEENHKRLTSASKKEQLLGTVVCRDAAGSPQELRVDLFMRLEAIPGN